MNSVETYRAEVAASEDRLRRDIRRLWIMDAIGGVFLFAFIVIIAVVT